MSFRAQARGCGLICALLTLASSAARLHAQTVTLDQTRLHFAVVRRADRIVAHTPEQVVFLEFEATTARAWRWSAATDREWLQVTPASGAGPARLSIGLGTDTAARVAAADTGRVIVTLDAGAVPVRLGVDATLTVVPERSAAPIGAFEAPAEGTVARAPHLALSGWALDDVGVHAIEICAERHPASGETPCADGTKTLIGRARVADGSRPDVAALFAATPLNLRSSWSFLLDRAQLPKGRRGTLRFVALAIDGEEHAAAIGSRSITFPPDEGRNVRWRGPLLLLALGGSFLALHAIAWSGLRRTKAAPPTVPQHAPVSLVEGLLVGAAISMSIVLYAVALTRGFAYDELYTASHYVVGAKLSETATSIAILNNHILYSLVATLCTWAAGTAEWVIRLPAAVLGAAAVYAVWRFTRVFAGAVAALLAAFALACLPFFVEWGRSARGYTALALAAVLSSRFFFFALRTGSARAAVWHAASTLLPMFVHLYAGWVLLVQYATFLILLVRRDRPHAGLAVLWRSFGAIVAGSVLLYLPLINDLLSGIAERGRAAFVPAFPLELFRAYAGLSSTLMLGWMAILLAAGVGRFRQRLEAVYLVALLAVPLIVIWALIKPLDLYPRYFAYWTPFFAVAVALGADALARYAAGRIAAPGRRDAVRAAVAAALLLVPGVFWMDQDLTAGDHGAYRAALEFRDRGLYRMAAVGADAEMFDYYLGKPLDLFHVPQDADRAMRELPPLAVAYHNVTWNTPQHRAVEALLRRRCVSEEAGAVTRFYCNSP